ALEMGAIYPQEQKKCLSLNGLPMNTRNLVHITGRIWWHWCNQPTSWLNCMNLSKAQPEQIVPLITNFSVDILHANSAPTCSFRIVAIEVNRERIISLEVAIVGKILLSTYYRLLGNCSRWIMSYYVSIIIEPEKNTSLCNRLFLIGP
ncbi:hypothetical protein ACJX0J_031873, partial [Zea mays]